MPTQEPTAPPTPAPQAELPPIELNFDLDDLDLGETADLAEALGLNLDELDRLSTPTPRMLPALVWIVKRRTDPAFTYEDARKIKLRQLSSPASAPAPAPAKARGRAGK